MKLKGGIILERCTIEDGIVTTVIEGTCLIEIYLRDGAKKPTTIHIPKEIDGNVIQSIGDGKNAICVYTNQLCGITLEIDDEISKINKNAFRKLRMNGIHWPAACKTVPERCFEYSSIGKLDGFDNIETIEASAFKGLRAPIVFTIPSTCKSIGREAFRELTSSIIKGGENVTDVGPMAFFASAIQNITWFPKAKLISYGMFAACRDLQHIEGLRDVKSMGIGIFEDSGITEIIWPDNCSSVPAHCFEGCVHLRKISNLTSVEKIKNKAFCKCRRLKDIVFPEKIRTIGENAFSGSGLEQYDLSNTCVEHIEKGAFENIPAGLPATYPISCVVDMFVT